MITQREKRYGNSMVKSLILYYLSIKPTHGYEIQKFIQLSGIDQWTKIQSGSIYYALTKLEKEKCIHVLKEERTGSRVRKIYEITDLGRNELEKEMRTELMTPIVETGSLKYVLYTMISVLTEQEAKELIEKHIADLEEKRNYWEYWRDLKGNATANKLMKLSFDMTIHSLEDQIAWHEELLHGLDVYRKESEDMAKMIKAFEPDCIPETAGGSIEEKELQVQLAQIERIKEAVESDPKRALEQLNEIMDALKKQTT